LERDLTILIIAHRLNTLKNCDFIVELKDGGIHRVSHNASALAHAPVIAGS